ncbi:MAG: ABC transporter permease [Mariprofundaceae bacterium]|nr:ABC transporter permease [Mariprofundaceae bacterium]
MDTTPVYSPGWNGRAERVGEAGLRMFSGLAQFYAFVAEILGHGLRLQWMARPAVLHVLVRQMYFTGVQGLPWVLTMVLAGAMAVYSVVPFAHRLNDVSLIGTLINNLLVQEMAPLLIGVFLLARLGVAVVTEIGHMHVRGEARLLKSMGIAAPEYLFLPRFIAFGLCGLILTMVFAAASVWTGGLMLAWTHEMDFAQFLLEVRHGASFEGMLLLLGKGLMYPLLCCAMLMFQGARAGNDPNRIPVVTTRGVLWALMLMIFADVSIALFRILA